MFLIQSSLARVLSYQSYVLKFLHWLKKLTNINTYINSYLLYGSLIYINISNNVARIKILFCSDKNKIKIKRLQQK